MNLTESQSKLSSMPSQVSQSQLPPENIPKTMTRIGTSNQMRVAIYIRVSDPSQVDGYSLDAQERQCIEYCRSRGWIVVRVYREEGRSARYEAIRKRPLFQGLLEDATRVEFDVVVVHTLDRWAITALASSPLPRTWTTRPLMANSPLRCLEAWQSSSLACSPSIRRRALMRGPGRVCTWAPYHSAMSPAGRKRMVRGRESVTLNTQAEYMFITLKARR